MTGDGWLRCDPDGLKLKPQGVRRLIVTLDYAWEGQRQQLDFPLAIFGHGEGPTMLLTGGTHGDELEGQAVAWHLIRSLSDADITGRLIIVPTHNRPACLACRRRSPIDGLDINRIYPGGDEAGPSHAIARFLAGRIMPSCDAYLDLHSGGSAHEFVLSSNLQGRPGTATFERDLPGLLAMDAPYAIVFDEDESDSMPHRGTTEAFFRGLGRPAFSSEYGGGGRLTALSFETALRGTINLLCHLGVLSGEAIRPDESRSQLLFMRGGAQYVPAPAKGLFLPRVALGETVSKGSLLGEIFPDEPASVVAELRSAVEGIVVALATRGPEVGEPAVMIAEPLPP